MLGFWPFLEFITGIRWHAQEALQQMPGQDFKGTSNPLLTCQLSGILGFEALSMCDTGLMLYVEEICPQI